MQIGIGIGIDKGFTSGAGSPPANTVAPVVSGTAVVGQTLTTTNGTWSNSPSGYTYQWYRGASAISGATSSTYVLVSSDAGQNIKCTVTASNSAGSASADSNTVAQVLDADANAFFTAIALTDSTIIAAENNFFISRKNVTALSNALASYHLVTDKSTNTDRLNQFKFNAYSPVDANANKRLTYTGTITANTTGLQSNGVNGAARTYINTSTDYTTSEFTVLFVSRTSQARNGADFGAVDGSASGINVGLKWADNNTYNSGFSTNASMGNVIADTLGIYSFKRSGDTITLKKNNTVVFTRTYVGALKPNLEIYLCARNFNNSVNVPTTREYSFFEFINVALTAQQETDFYNALVTREAALGR